MRRDAVLVDEPEQRACVANDWMVHRPAFLRDPHALEPLRKTLRHILLKKSWLADAAVVPLHRHRTGADVWQHYRRDRFVIGSELALGDSLVGEEHFVRMR